MPRYTARVSVKMTWNEKDRLESEASDLGFLSGKGQPNLSEYIRWTLKYGQKPIDRSYYFDALKHNANLLRLGGLFNQYMFHLNRELRIMNDKGIVDNNKRLCREIENQIKDFTEMRAMIKDTHRVLHEILVQESC